jgi:predicted O-methyltransferase YrrM
MTLQTLRQLCYALTILLSAFLLFQIQPLISKFILPWFGGSPSVWTSAMLFFQCALCGGYFYAFLLSRRFSPQRQALIHLLLLALAAGAAAFIIPDASLKPAGDEDPVRKIVALLALSVGLPYFFLATTGPLVQHWYARAHPTGSAFRLYALSNAGSLFALLSFPYLFEPFFAIQEIGRLWTWGFWTFAALCAGSVLLNLRLATPGPAQAQAQAGSGPAPAGAAPSAWHRALWVALPALASLAFIATTDHVSHDIAPEPRLWITTLGLYLLTFIVCFDHPRWYQRRLAAPLLVLALLLLTGRDELPGLLGLQWEYSLDQTRWAHFATMFLVCFVAHGELYRLRPSHARYLTEYYLLMSVGGACGGLFVSLVATDLFSDYHEWPLMLLAALLLAGGVIWRELAAGARRPMAAAAVLAVAALVVFWEDPLSLRQDSASGSASTRLYQARNFYGTVTVADQRQAGAPAADQRVFYSGQVIHGVQFLQPERRRANLTYYGEDSGAGQALRHAAQSKPALKVAIVGLGAGTLANYARESDEYDFFEINPEVIHVAEKWFDNLALCKARTQRMYLGDARLKFETLPADRRYDLIVLDAFSGGSVPLHLLTREAFALYARHLAPDGLIVAHITNSYLDLYPVVRRQAQALGLNFRAVDQAYDGARGINFNRYFVMGLNPAYFAAFGPDAGSPTVRSSGLRPEDAPLWTDSFSSIAPIELKR